MIEIKKVQSLLYHALNYMDSAIDKAEDRYRNSRNGLWQRLYNHLSPIRYMILILAFPFILNIFAIFLFVILALYACHLAQFWLPMTSSWKRSLYSVYIHPNYTSNEQSISILQNCKTITESRFNPTWYTTLIPFWNMSGHLQTFLHEFVRDIPEMEFERVLIPTEDGFQIALDYKVREKSRQWEKDCPIMLIIHGVTGGSHSQYVRHYAKTLEKHNIRPIVLNARGCSSSELKSPVYFACHFTDDIHCAVTHIKNEFPGSPILATAYSLGANLLTKYVGEQGRDCKLTSAIACANPFDWMKIDKWLRTGVFNKYVYNFILTKSLTNYLGRHKHVFDDHETVKIDRVLESTTLQEYDTLITCNLWGFESIEQYYLLSSGKRFLKNISIPFLTIQALDDPLIPTSVIPYSEFEVSLTMFQSFKSNNFKI